MELFKATKNKIFLAPMAGITDLAFRRICASFGAGFTYTEMVSAKGIQYGNTKTKDLIRVSGEEGKAGLQLFGSDPAVLAQTVRYICREYSDKIAVIDINMGCPAPKIVRNSEGCALMQNPVLAGKIIEVVKKESTLPVTVKFRKGWDEESLNAVAFAKMAQDAGADGLTVHGRTRMQFYSGKADWEIIGKIKSALRIPVIGNGDIHYPHDAINMMRQTRCDAVMVARGALGNPFIFREIIAMQEGKNIEPVSLEERVKTVLLHLKLAVEDKGERRAIREFRKHAAWYVKGIKNAAKLRELAVQADTYEKMEALFYSLLF